MSTEFWNLNQLQTIHLIDDDDNKFEIEAPLDISIEEFKKILLNFKNKPFFLEFNIDN